MPRLFYRNSRTSMKDLINAHHTVTDIAEGPFYTLRDNDTAESALKLGLKGASSILIRNKHGNFQGILTNRDMLDFLGGGEKHRFMLSKGLKTPVRKLLTRHAKREWRIHKDETALSAFIAFRRFGKESHAITDGDRIYGLVTERDFLKYINRPTGIKVEGLMAVRPFSVSEDTPLSEAARIICRGAFRKLPVTKKGIVTGILTPYDMISYALRKKNLKALPRDSTPISRVMNKWVSTVKQHSDVFEAVRIMRNKNIGFLPVTYDGELQGIITARDIITGL